MRRKLLYFSVVAAILVLFTVVAIAILWDRSDLALAAAATLVTSACLMLVENRWSLHRSVSRLERLSERVDGTARRSDIAAATDALNSIVSSGDDVARTLEIVAQQQSGTTEELEAISRRNQHFHTEVRTGLRQLRHEPLVLQIAALLQLNHRFAPQAPLIAAGAWALSPTVVVEIVDTIAREQPRLVVECGSGLSTVWLGYAVREVGHGRLVALEHNETFRAQTMRMVEQHALTDVVEVRYAPLATTQVGNEKMPWYSGPLDDLQDIGVLLVDGPPAATGASARYPAMARLRRSLAPGAAIILDDIVREDERAVVSRWLDEDDTLELAHEVPGGSVVLRAR